MDFLLVFPQIKESDAAFLLEHTNPVVKHAFIFAGRRNVGMGHWMLHNKLKSFSPSKSIFCRCIFLLQSQLHVFGIFQTALHI